MDVTSEFIAEARRTAEYEAERFPSDDWPPIVLALLDALDAAAARVAAAERELSRARAMKVEAETELAETIADASVAEARAAETAEREALERVLDAALSDPSFRMAGTTAPSTALSRIVHDLMPRKDGEP